MLPYRDNKALPTPIASAKVGYVNRHSIFRIPMGKCMGKILLDPMLLKKWPGSHYLIVVSQKRENKI